jgi:D-alanine-D-alanine ligase
MQKSNLGGRRRGARPHGAAVGPDRPLQGNAEALFDTLDLPGEAVAGEAAAARIVAQAGIGPDDRVLDMGCGAAGLCLALARRGFKGVTGAERSRHLIRMARRASQQAGLAVRFLERDPRELLPRDGRYDLVALTGNRFALFAADDARAVLEAAKRVLRPGAHLVLEIDDGAWLKAHFVPSEWRWVDADHLVCRERSLSAEGDRLICRDILMHRERGIAADRFYAVVLYTAERIRALLAEAGFAAVRVVEQAAADGAAPRLMLLAEMPRAKAAEAPLRPPFPDVTVILGDPRLADNTKIGDRYTPEDFEAVDKMKAALATLSAYRFTYIDDHATLLATLTRERPAFVFNMCDNGYKNDATRELEVPALLDLLEIPYTGAGPTCLGMCYDKSLVRALASAHGVPVPRETYFDMTRQAGDIPSLFPALIKPNRADGSVGITTGSVVYDAEAAIAYLNRLRRTVPGRDALIQEYLTGAEYSVGLIGNPGLGFTVLPPLEVDYSGLDPELPHILSFESKFDPNSPYFTEIKYRRADITETVRRHLADYSRILFERLECRDYARFDFRADSAGEIRLLEVNPNPAWCWDGKLAMMAGFAGYGYPDLLRLILEAAQSRALSEGLGRSKADPLRARMES